MKLTKYEITQCLNPADGQTYYYLLGYVGTGAYIYNYSYLAPSDSLTALYEEYSASDLYWNGTSSDWTASRELGEIPGERAGWTAFADNRSYNSFYADGRKTFFTDQASGEEHQITLAGALKPSQVIVASNQNYRFTGLGFLTGEMELIKAESGTLFLSNDNTYTGGTFLQGGTLKITSANALGSGTVHATQGIFDLGYTPLANDISISRGNVQIRNAENYRGNLRVESGTLETKTPVTAASLSSIGGEIVMHHRSSISTTTISIKENTKICFLLGNQSSNFLEGDSLQFSGNIILAVDSEMAYSELNQNRTYSATLVSTGYEINENRYISFGKDYGSWQGVEINPLLYKYLDKGTFYLYVTCDEFYGAGIEFTANVNTGSFYADGSINPQLGEMGKKGGAMLDAALHHSDPQTTQSDSRLALLMNAVDAAIAKGDVTTAAHLEAALTGNTTTCLAAAYADQTTSHLNSLLNMVHMRTTGGKQAAANSFKPSIWFRGDYSRHKLAPVEELAGYILNSWGGTLGADVNIAPRLIAGAAFSASRGDLKSNAADTARGNLNCVDMTLYAQGGIGQWEHVVLFSGGTADIKLNRTLPVAGETRGSTSGYEWGALYEAAYSFRLPGNKKEAAHLLTPLFQMGWTSVHVDGYRETGAGNAGLAVGKQNNDYGTCKLGMRYMISTRTGLSPMPWLFETQAGVIQYLGSRRGTSSVGLQGYGSGVYSINGSEPDRTRAELNARIIIPATQQTDFMISATAELGARSSQYNASMGLRYQF